jgi:hypothetical protein
MVSITVKKNKKKKPTLKERADFQQTPEGRKLQQERAERIKKRREAENKGKKVIFKKGRVVIPAKEDPKLFGRQEAERKRVNLEEQKKDDKESGAEVRKFIDIEKGKITARETAEKELADEKKQKEEAERIKLEEQDRVETEEAKKTFVDNARGDPNAIIGYQEVEQIIDGSPTGEMIQIPITRGDQLAMADAHMDLISLGSSAGITKLSSSGAKAFLSRSGKVNLDKLSRSDAAAVLIKGKHSREFDKIRTTNAWKKKFGINDDLALKLWNKLERTPIEAIKEFTFSRKGAIIGTGGFYLGLRAMGTNSQMMWLASDNVLTGGAMYVKNLKWAVKDGMPIEKAQELFEETQETVNWTRSFISSNANKNPETMPYVKLLERNAEQVQRSLDLIRDELWG